MSGLKATLPPDNKYINDAIKPIPKTCEDKDTEMHRQIREVPHVLNPIQFLNCRKLELC